MLGRELMQFILDNNILDDEIVVINPEWGGGRTEDVQQFNITDCTSEVNDDGDTVGVLVVNEQ